MKTVEELFNKYGLILPQTKGPVKISFLANPAGKTLVLPVKAARFDQDFDNYTLPWDEADDFIETSGEAFPQGVNLLEELYWQLMKWEKETRVAQLVYPDEMYPDKMGTIGEFFKTSQLQTLIANRLRVCLEQLRNRKEDVIFFLEHQINNSRSIFLEDYQKSEDQTLTMVEISELAVPLSVNTHVKVKGFRKKAWGHYQKAWALKTCLLALGQRPENKTLAKDFILVNSKIIELVDQAYKLPRTNTQEKLSESQEEIYTSLKKQAVKEQDASTPCNITCTQILNSALELA